MTPGLTANVAGESYDLNDGVEIMLLDYDLSLATVRRLAQRYPAQQGDTDLGQQTQARFEDIFWGIRGQSLSNYRQIRARFSEVWRARTADPVQLIFNFGDYQRALDVNLDGGLVWSEETEKVGKVSGTFKASDSRLYDPEARSLTFSLLASAASGLPIPFTIPIPIGGSELDGSETIAYAGLSRLAAIEFPIITITGPIQSPIIRNVTTGEMISLQGLEVAQGGEVVIDLAGQPRRDSKMILDENGDSVAQFLTTDSDLATWHLSYAGERLRDGSYSTGNNVIEVSGSGANALTTVRLDWFDRYEGD